MRQSVSWQRRIAGGVAALSLACSLVPATAFAHDATDVPEWAVDDGDNVEVFPQAELPTAYDMRDYGLVTPVKLQNPWGSCWAFGGTAAAESSLLSANGTTYALSGLDLSERHLVYFAQHPVSELEDPDQVGEGIHLLIDGENAEFNSGGGVPVYITTLFAQGIGPMAEGDFPYVGATGRTGLDDLNDDLEKDLAGTVWNMLTPSFPGATHEEIMQTMMQSPAFGPFLQEKGVTNLDEFVSAMADWLRKDQKENVTYSKNDDWRIPATDEYGRSNRMKSGGFVLTHGNILPEYHNADGTPNEDSMNAIKQEMLNGRAVSITYHADQTSRYSRDGKQYIQADARQEDRQPNHAVCLVGWDDTYPRENFKIVDGAGSEVRPIPPRDGAWIMKNSWGSETDRVEIAEGSYLHSKAQGYKNEDGKSTGYFYLSYYDASIGMPETMEFSSDLSSDGAFYTMQHDYAPARAGFVTVADSSNVVSAANVFSTEGQAFELRSVSVRTTEANMRVTFSIYEMNEGATEPTDGKPLKRFSRNFEYGGFHRADLEIPVTIGKDKKFSVVTTTSRIEQDGTRTYVAAATAGFDEDVAKTLAGGLNFYIKTIVNDGESYLYRHGAWQDWKTASPEFMTGEYQGMNADNFPIKAYGVAAEEPTMGGATRIYGQEALDTMSAIVRAGNFSKGGIVVLTTADGYWDALTASGIAGLANAPVIMTSSFELSEQTAHTLKQLEPTRIIICGGESVVSEDVAAQAGAAAGGAEVFRVAGQEAPDTAVAIYEQAQELVPGAWSNEAFLCTSAGYWDALAVSPISYAQHMPIFLTNGPDSISNTTIEALVKGGFSKVYIVGGVNAITPAVEQQLRDAGIELADRIAGETAIDTSGEAASYGISLGMTANGMGIATADGYWDALSGGPFCGKMNSVIVLVSGPDSSTITGFISDHATDINGAYVFGGPSAVREDTFAAVTRAIG